MSIFRRNLGYVVAEWPWLGLLGADIVALVVLRRLEVLKEDRTIIQVTHRMDFESRCDRILLSGMDAFTRMAVTRN